jgi:hypothetical protein
MAQQAQPTDQKRKIIIFSGMNPYNHILVLSNPNPEQTLQSHPIAKKSANTN